MKYPAGGSGAVNTWNISTLLVATSYEWGALTRPVNYVGFIKFVAVNITTNQTPNSKHPHCSLDLTWINYSQLNM